MKKSFLILVGIACLFTIYSCRNSSSDNKDSEVFESEPTKIKQEMQQKETSLVK